MTTAQLRKLGQLVKNAPHTGQNRDLTARDLTAIGCEEDAAVRVEKLLSEETQLDNYLTQGAKYGCSPLTWVTPGYPEVLRQRLGLDSPGALWYKGDLSLLEKPMIALVGSRDLYSENRAFAAAVGALAAQLGYALVSGNARGADTEAQESCLRHGGCVISVVADQLCKAPVRKNVLYLVEDGYDLPFSATRALSRNRVIHALPKMTFVAQCSLERGGTWKGTTQNLRQKWSAVCCCDDGSAASRALEKRGAVLIRTEQLKPEYLIVL